MNKIQKLIGLAAMIAIFAYDRVARQSAANIYPGLIFLVVLTLIGIYLLRDKKKEKKNKES